jgi:hypothetical protein
MATQEAQILALVNQLGLDNKSLRTLLGNLSSLSTTQKGSIVAALNEVYTMASTAASSGGATINDTTPTTTTAYSSSKVNAVVAALINDSVTVSGTTWSGSKIDTSIKSAVAALVGAAPSTLDTIAELAAALGDAGAITAINTALGNRVRFDAAQSLTAAQKVTAKANIDAYGALEIGNPAADFLSAYNAAKA